MLRALGMGLASSYTIITTGGPRRASTAFTTTSPSKVGGHDQRKIGVLHRLLCRRGGSVWVSHPFIAIYEAPTYTNLCLAITYLTSVTDFGKKPTQTHLVNPRNPKKTTNFTFNSSAAASFCSQGALRLKRFPGEGERSQEF